MSIATAEKTNPAGIPAGHSARTERGFVAELRAKGLRPIPLVRDGKTPTKAAKGFPTNGVSYLIRANENVGIDAGFYFDGRALLIVDLDVKNGVDGLASWAALQAEHGAAPETFTVETPTGGRHLYFVADTPVSNTQGKLGSGIDVRGRGGYCVAPGSTIGGKPYTVARDRFLADAPQWLIDACGQPRERIDRAEEITLTGYAAEVALAKARAYLLNEAPLAVEGDAGDATTYRVACRVRDFGVSKDECLSLMLDWNDRCQPPWGTAELEAKVRNAYNFAKGEAGADNPAVVFDPVANASKPHTTYRIVPAGDLLDEAEPEWLIAGLVPACGLGVIYGEPGVGKSFLALDIAAAIARGLAWGKRSVRRPGPVVYVGLEGRQKLRVEAYMKHHERDRAAMRNVHVIQGQPLDLSHPKYEPVAILARDIKDVVPGVRAVFIDTLSRALHGGDENSSEDMGRAVAAADGLGKQLGCTVVLVHHSGKDSKKGARGHSLLHGATDVELEVTRNGEVREVKAVKVKDGEDGLRWKFDLRPVWLGVTADGETRSACVIENLEPVHGSLRPLSKAQTAVLEALKQATDAKMGEATTGADGFAELSASREEWRAAYYNREGATDAAGRNRLRARFNSGSSALVKHEKVRSCGADRFALADGDA